MHHVWVQEGKRSEGERVRREGIQRGGERNRIPNPPGDLQATFRTPAGGGFNVSEAAALVDRDPGMAAWSASIRTGEEETAQQDKKGAVFIIVTWR
ncbi:hypothetical protein EYF80_040133 [Liparis tanakae]|uniref:Uncharacterized protein n=1 Tax=Liparis tanakae TaxID=230148 RepID=A0A4Z2G9Q5_9TELE|nr:hypothetical protein EYF80_040133 [Liparis tanakae]